MHIGIILHSPKGRTAFYAKKLVKVFENQNNKVTIELLEPVDEGVVGDKITLKNYPKIEEYDTIMLGAPIVAGSLSPVMEAYLLQLDPVKHQTASGFITHSSLSFSKNGQEARERMIELLVTKNIKVVNLEIIKWLNPFQKRTFEPEELNKPLIYDVSEKK